MARHIFSMNHVTVLGFPFLPLKTVCKRMRFYSLDKIKLYRYAYVLLFCRNENVLHVYFFGFVRAQTFHGNFIPFLKMEGSRTLL